MLTELKLITFYDHSWMNDRQDYKTHIGLGCTYSDATAQKKKKILGSLEYDNFMQKLNHA